MQTDLVRNVEENARFSFNEADSGLIIKRNLSKCMSKSVCREERERNADFFFFLEILLYSFHN